MGEHLALDASVSETPRRLDGHWRRPPAQRGSGDSLRHDPGRRVGHAHVQHLPRADEVVERAKHFVDRRGCIPHVEPQQVDVVGAESPQAAFDRSHHVLAVVAAGVRVVPPLGQRVLRGYDEVIPLGGDELAHEPFGRPVRVVVRRVDEVAAGIREPVEDAAALFVRRSPSPVLTERHGAERHLRHPEPTRSQQLVPHHAPPSRAGLASPHVYRIRRIRQRGGFRSGLTRVESTP